MKALSIRQPWCHHILHDGKDVENRSWSTRYRGDVLIHASQSLEEDRVFIRDYNLPLGGIVGVVEIVDCVQALDSRWFFGPYGFVLRNARPIELIPCPGKLGFFDVPAHVAQLVEASLS
ncbi:ASCH domain-containing protein [Rhizorhabdus sp.]|uniref:ASCH domain-containing protein n=1 Tax=Rhizorhabdus sp. TaxID=1968843 RepID=UPI0035B3F6B9